MTDVGAIKLPTLLVFRKLRVHMDGGAPSKNALVSVNASDKLRLPFSWEFYEG